MSITYTWSIKKVDTVPAPELGTDNYIVDVTYVVTGTDGDKTLSLHSSVGFLPENQNGPCTPYAELTEEQILSWVKSDQYRVETIEGNVAFLMSGQFSQNQQPTPTATALPWANTQAGE